MGSFLSVFSEEEPEKFDGLTEEEAREVHDDIKKEYGHPSWSNALVKYRSSRRRKKNWATVQKNLSVIVESEGTDKDGTVNDNTIVVGVDGVEIDKELFKKVIQDWESLESDHGGSLEEEDNLNNVLEEIKNDFGSSASVDVHENNDNDIGADPNAKGGDINGDKGEIDNDGIVVNDHAEEDDDGGFIVEEVISFCSCRTV